MIIWKFVESASSRPRPWPLWDEAETDCDYEKHDTEKPVIIVVIQLRLRKTPYRKHVIIVIIQLRLRNTPHRKAYDHSNHSTATRKYTKAKDRNKTACTTIATTITTIMLPSNCYSGIDDHDTETLLPSWASLCRVFSQDGSADQRAPEI